MENAVISSRRVNWANLFTFTMLNIRKQRPSMFEAVGKMCLDMFFLSSGILILYIILTPEKIKVPPNPMRYIA